jgi:predicted O-linked N-acetylglucosamine transferase (SPINDLY family)
LQTMAGDTQQAIASFEAVLEKNPGNDSARATKLHAQAKLNDWSWIEEYQNHRRQLGLTGKPCAPFYTLAFEDNPDLLRLRTQAYATALLPMAQPVVQPAAPLAAEPATTERPHRLRIGYFSPDYHDHATMRLMAGLFEAHDKSRFDIIAYSYDTAPVDAMRSRVTSAVSSFRDISQMSDSDVVKMVQQDGLDIAVDLKGFSGDSRTALFSHRLAPLQMSYLGFPGTLGTTALDYFICDHVSCPPGSERFFEEYLIRMPHSHQANDNKRSMSGRQFTRKDCGLPNDGFVFCSFNSSYKITPAEFDIWMRLLDQVEGSVLWLLDCGESARENLRREAEQRGQDPDRLIFAPRVPQADHLARHPVADLFLDTFVVNGHATASDALWAGVPVLTRPGQQFAARVGASLVSAIGLPEMIATSAEDYEARALELARDADALAALRAKLQRNRLTTSLFDTVAFTRMLESAYDRAHSRSQSGLPPAHLEVTHLEATGSLDPDTPTSEVYISPAALRQQPPPPGQIAPQAG